MIWLHHPLTSSLIHPTVWLSFQASHQVISPKGVNDLKSHRSSLGLVDDRHMFASACVLLSLYCCLFPCHIESDWWTISASPIGWSAFPSKPLDGPTSSPSRLVYLATNQWGIHSRSPMSTHAVEVHLVYTIFIHNWNAWELQKAVARNEPKPSKPKPNKGLRLTYWALAHSFIFQICRMDSTATVFGSSRAFGLCVIICLYLDHRSIY